jgi:FAD/FMN-containing dehydrogenase
MRSALLHAGRAHKYDLSLPLPKMYALVEDVRECMRCISSEVEVCGYGHFGDGNLHLNVSDGRASKDQVGCWPAFTVLGL